MRLSNISDSSQCSVQKSVAWNVNLQAMFHALTKSSKSSIFEPHCLVTVWWLWIICSFISISIMMSNHLINRACQTWPTPTQVHLSIDIDPMIFVNILQLLYTNCIYWKLMWYIMQRLYWIEHLYKLLMFMPLLLLYHTCSVVQTQKVQYMSSSEIKYSSIVHARHGPL